jgi:multiple sugar transport system substrate-binding protein
MQGILRFVRIALLALITALAVACGAVPQSSSTPANPAATNAPANPKVVRVLAVAGPETDSLIARAAEFEKATGITASIEQVARPLWGERKVRELIEDAGLYDVVMIGGGDDLAWVKTKGHWQPLDTYLSQEDLAQLLHREDFVQDGKLMGVPQYFNFPMLFYRKDLLENPAEQAAFKAKYGRDLSVPQTYDELREVAEFFHRPPELYGFFIGGVDWSIFLDHTYYVYGMGANYGDLQSGKLMLNTPEQKRALGVLADMTQFNPPGWQTMSFFDGDELVQQGKVFMYQNWFYIWKTFQETMPDKMGMAPPAGDKQPGAHLGAFVAVMPKAAPNPDAAGAFIKWMYSPAYQQNVALDTGNLPVRQDVLKDAAVRDALPGIELFEQTLPYAQSQQVTWANELSSGVGEAITRVLDGEMTAEQAADWLQDTKFVGRQAIER